MPTAVDAAKRLLLLAHAVTCGCSYDWTIHRRDAGDAFDDAALPTDTDGSQRDRDGADVATNVVDDPGPAEGKGEAGVLLHDASVMVDADGDSSADASAPSDDGHPRLVAMGRVHSCALFDSGKVRCWGANSDGALGNGNNASSNVPVAVLNLNTAVSIDAGGDSSCAVRLDKTVACWGANAFGQLGDGTIISSSVPVEVRGIDNAESVSVGETQACAVRSDRTVSCWGKNDSGQLGNGTRINSPVPVAVAGLVGASSVSVGSQHACALRSDDRVTCWGNNDFGQLGNDTTTGANVPSVVSGIGASSVLVGAIQLAAGAVQTCATRSDGSVSCWGSNVYGSLGRPGGNALRPVAVSGLSKATQVSASGHGCARLLSGAVYCWGYNPDGRLGNGTQESSSVPVPVTNLDAATAVDTGTYHSCALKVDRSVVCWGYNSSGQLGDGTNLDSSSPTSVIHLP